MLMHAATRNKVAFVRARVTSAVPNLKAVCARPHSRGDLCKNRVRSRCDANQDGEEVAALPGTGFAYFNDPPFSSLSSATLFFLIIYCPVDPRKAPAVFVTAVIAGLCEPARVSARKKARHDPACGIPLDRETDRERDSG